MNLQATNSLRGALAGLYYREGCDQNGWAYISLEDIHSSSKDASTLVFRKGAHKINVKIMQSVVPEIKEMSRPAGNSFLFDYLACKVGQKDRYDSSPIVANPVALCWVKAGGGSAFSSSQVEALGKAKLPVAIFRIRDVLAPPRQIEIRWDIKSGEEWLDELDERREEAESDDEYF